ncbi:MAG: Eco57I restriction-modification methylase domain-containing protein [Terriglobales bacterium]
MSTLSREHRRMLENTVAQARVIAEEGAQKVLRDQYAVHHHEPWPHMTADDRKLRNQLRAHGRQLGDRRDPKRETQEIEHLVQACAYEHWHRMLFARFLAENDLLLDAQHGVAMTLDDVRELAREQGRDWMDVAAELAQRMLLAVFRPDDPVLKVQLPPETRQQLEEKLASLPREVFKADDSLGWVYQFWQRDEKDRINASEVKIGADELAAVTQLFTEDYMVLFLLHNTLGAWWAGKVLAANPEITLHAKDEDELRAACSVGGYEWTYLRFLREGATAPWRPAAGTFDGWPRVARDLKVLDPCEGSGHFLVFALPILMAFRKQEEGLSREQAVDAVLRDNLFGLELDNRCTQIAAFNLALAAWRIVGYRPLPTLNVACSGLGINAKEEDWVRLAGGDERARETMRRLFHLFQQAPVLGSLIDPKRVGGSLFVAEFEKVRPILEKALTEEQKDESSTELAVVAQGIVQAARILTSEFTLVATNVPYLARSKQDAVLQEFCEREYSESKTNLATACVQRCVSLCSEGGTVAVVSVQTWLFQVSYKHMRKTVLRTLALNFVVPLGMRSFQTQLWDFPVALLSMTRSRPDPSHSFSAIDLADSDSYESSSKGIRTNGIVAVGQKAQNDNPDQAITLAQSKIASMVRQFASCVQGIKTGDDGRVRRNFWELPKLTADWKGFQSTVATTRHFGGLENVLWWGDSGENLARRQGLAAWGKLGVAISQMSNLPCAIYLGEPFDSNMAALVPRKPEYLRPLVAFCFSEEFAKEVRKIDQSLKPTNSSFEKIPFELARWDAVAQRAGSLPTPFSDDPTQWVFKGNIDGSTAPLQVAVARLVGYRWPRQTGSSFIDCPAVGPDGLEKHASSDGIVCLSPLPGLQASAGDRLRALLADAYGKRWSAAKLAELISDAESLEVWLRDHFFEEHCQIFDQRPFVWHLWDGRKDGFHALVSYHTLAAANGEGRATLEKLIYTYLGRWIERQTDEVRVGKEGADARFTAATQLKAELEKILKGEKPYDIFVRWKPLHEQPIGWEPDINDGVRMNIRPWLTAKVYQPSRRDGCILRVTPKIPYGKDRGNEPHRAKEEFPWFWTWDEQSEDFMGGDKFDGARWNDLHYSLDKKKEAREKRSSTAVSAARGRNR